MEETKCKVTVYTEKKKKKKKKKEKKVEILAMFVPHKRNAQLFEAT